MNQFLKKTSIVSVSALMLLSLGAGTVNASASKRNSSPQISRYSTIWAGRPMSKRRQIRMEHKYFFVSTRDVNNPAWYLKNCHKILRYVGEEPATLSQMASHFYTNQSRSFMKGYNDNSSNDHGGYFYLEPNLIRHHINPNAYKEGWVMQMAAPGYGDHFTLKEFKSALSEYHLIAYGPTRRQRNRWARFEIKNVRPSVKQSNNPRWYFHRYEKDYQYYLDHNSQVSSVKRQLFMTNYGVSFNRGLSDEYTIHTPHKHNSLRYLRRHRLDPLAYKCGWIVGKYAQATGGSQDRVPERDFTKWIHDYNR